MTLRRALWLLRFALESVAFATVISVIGIALILFS